MSAFEAVLAEYKAAVLAAEPDMATKAQRGLYDQLVKAVKTHALLTRTR